jgi:DNA polymerase III gamma/tau subunit
MQSILIVGNKEKIREKAQQICDQEKVNKFDIKVIDSEKAVGIAQTRLLQKNIFLTPNSGSKKAVILESFWGITQDAQNSLLKILEEPPEDTIIMILVTSLDFVLPTIQSRCKIINLLEKSKLNAKEKLSLLTLFEDLKKDRISSALLIAQDYSKDRETALDFLENLTIAAHENLETEKSFGKILKNLQSTYNNIKGTNVNIRFALENLFLNL